MSNWKDHKDEERWELVEEALSTPDLKTVFERLAAIGCIVQSRKLATEADLERTRKLAQRFGWEQPGGQHDDGG